MPLTLDHDIAELLQDTKVIALVIASRKPERTSNQIFHYLLGQGYTVYPINSGHGGEEIADRKIYTSLADVPEPIDMVDVFRRSQFVEPIVDAAIAAGAKAIWMQQGVINIPAANKAEAAGLKVVMDTCPAQQIPRLTALGHLP
jgi:uncharacterized protein